jgi:hypothetical protein
MRFALITEGASEHRIIKHILEKYCKEQEPYIRQIQPQVVNDKQETKGGWPEVLKYCQREDDLRNIFIDSDYLVIQIDTDKSPQKPFSVSHTKPDNSLKTNTELYVDIVDKLKGLMHPSILEEFENKIIFAVCIHTIECWLLPIYYNNHHQSDTGNCLYSLNTKLGQQNLHIISPNGKNNPNSIRTYETILKNWKRKTEISASAKHSDSFKEFINSLNIVVTT